VSETEPDAVRDTPQTSSNQPATDQTAPDASGQPARSPAQEPVVHSPGDVNDEKGYVAVVLDAAPGTSEQSPEVEGVRKTAVAQPGKPDGEVAT
jgi:hypothetical protein